MKPKSATQAAAARMASLTPKISWMRTTTPAGVALGSTMRALKLPDPSEALIEIVAIAFLRSQGCGRAYAAGGVPGRALPPGGLFVLQSRQRQGEER